MQDYNQGKDFYGKFMVRQSGRTASVFLANMESTGFVGTVHSEDGTYVTVDRNGGLGLNCLETDSHEVDIWNYTTLIRHLIHLEILMLIWMLEI